MQFIMQIQDNVEYNFNHIWCTSAMNLLPYVNKLLGFLLKIHPFVIYITYVVQNRWGAGASLSC